MLNNPFVQVQAQAPVSPAQVSTPEAATTPTSGELPRPYKCPLCTKAFHRLEHQTRHIRTHTGEKPHACNFPGCSKRFSRSDELTRHARIHSNPTSRRNGRVASQGVASSLPHHQAIPGDNSSNESTPNTSPPDRGVIISDHRGPRYSGDCEEMNVLATAAAQQLEQEKAGSHHSSYQPSTQYRQFAYPAHSSYNSSHFNSGPYNRPTLAMSRQHSQDDDDNEYGVGNHRSKRSRPGSPVFSTAPNSPLASHKHSPTPDYTPLATPAHSPRLHPRELDALHGIHLPSIRELSLRGLPPKLTPLEVDPFHPSSGYSSPQSHRDHPPVSATKLSDILESTSDNRRLPVPRVSISDLVSLNPSTTSANGSSMYNPSSPRSTPQSRSSSHINLRDLI